LSTDVIDTHQEVVMLQRCAALIGVAGLVVTVACGQTDAGITTSVKSKLAADDTVKASQVDVDTRNGVVTLSGNVESMAAKDQAVRIARETSGVQDVVDQIRVSEAAATGGAYDDDRGVGVDDRVGAAADRAGERADDAADRVGAAADRAADRAGDAADRAVAAVSDATITATVKTKFIADGTVQGMKIDVDTSGGVVTLNGTAPSRAAADRAVALARETNGVARVVDNIRVEGR
jgi:hyperosmotically inducible protein